MRVAMGLVLAGALGVGLVGCGPKRKLSEEEYRAVSATLTESPSFRQFVMKKCIAGAPKASKKDIAFMSALMDVPESRAPQEACRRIVRDIAKGRVTRDEFETMRADDFSPAVIRALKTP